MSINFTHHSPLPTLPEDFYPCPECSKPLIPEEFFSHLKSCKIQEGCSYTDRDPCYTVMSTYDESLVTCQNCSRKFLPGRISKHSLFCKNLTKKRPIFNKKISSSLDPQAKSKKKTVLTEQFQDKLWHRQHTNVIQNIRFGRNFDRKKGNSSLGIKSPDSLAGDLVECPVCRRKFAPVPASRHIPLCKNIVHKPKPLPLCRETSSKLPKIRTFRLKEIVFTEAECSIFDDDPALDSPGGCYQGPSAVCENKERNKSCEIGKYHSKCPRCKKQIKEGRLKSHLVVCRAQKEGADRKLLRCPNCEFSILPQAKYCMMCGLKLNDS